MKRQVVRFDTSSLPEPRSRFDRDVRDKVIALAQAASDGHQEGVRARHQVWLMQIAANVLKTQDRDAATTVRAHLAPLSTWLCKCDLLEESRRWSTVCELLGLVFTLRLPLSQLRCASAVVSRTVISMVASSPGISTSEILEKLDEDEGISCSDGEDTLRWLEKEGLLHIFRTGDVYGCFLACNEHSLFRLLEPMTNVLVQLKKLED